MIKYVRGNLLEASTEAIVNTVNTVGIMGKGIALQFKKAFPDNFAYYEAACKRNEIKVGKVHVFRRLQQPRYIINFPTKQHWKAKSRIEDIATGLESLAGVIREYGIKSIAMPPLGCGLGGLPWPKVRAMIEQTFANMPDVSIFAYEPAGAPRPEDMPIRTNKPKMTISQAIIITLMDRYASPLFNEFVSLLEIQKLTYFQQVCGEKLSLHFNKGNYGPYADNLRHVLNRMDGHYISGWGDGQNKPRTPLHLLAGAVEEANRLIGQNIETNSRLTRISNLIDGFETPYGMELLGTVHWVITQELRPPIKFDDVVQAIKSWTKRKENLFTPDHIEVALRRLVDSCLISPVD